jgi:hypothetical protein
MRREFVVLVSSAVLAVPALADLGTVSVKETGIGPNLIMTVHRAGATADNKQVYVGLQNLNLKEYNSEPVPQIIVDSGLKGNFQTFCIDIWDWSSSSYNPYDVVALDKAPDPLAAPIGGMGVVKAGRLAELLNRYWPETGALTDIQAAALQAAIWEIVNEDAGEFSAYNVNAGTFSLSGGTLATDNRVIARGQANSWLQSLTDDIGLGSYLALTSPSHLLPGGTQIQDYVIRVVPVPGAVLLGFLGLGYAGMRLRKVA